MRAALAAFAAALALAETAAAQQTLPAQCTSFTPAPALPDGATANNSAMRQAREALDAWRTTRAAELAACNAAAQQLQAQALAGAAAYNAAATETDATIARFAAENEEYSGRSPSSRRDRSAVLTRPDR